MRKVFCSSYFIRMLNFTYLYTSITDITKKKACFRFPYLNEEFEPVKDDFVPAV